MHARSVLLEKGGAGPEFPFVNRLVFLYLHIFFANTWHKAVRRDGDIKHFLLLRTYVYMYVWIYSFSIYEYDSKGSSSQGMAYDYIDVNKYRYIHAFRCILDINRIPGEAPRKREQEPTHYLWIWISMYKHLHRCLYTDTYLYMNIFLYRIREEAVRKDWHMKLSRAGQQRNTLGIYMISMYLLVYHVYVCMWYIWYAICIWNYRRMKI